MVFIKNNVEQKINILLTLNLIVTLQKTYLIKYFLVD